MWISTLTLAGGEFTWDERLTSLFAHHQLQLLCSMLIGGVLGVLGCFVVLRRMALIGDAISHAVLPGVVIAFLLVSTGIAGLFVGALLAGVLTAVGINLLTRFSRVKEDAAIGIAFTAMFALGIILVSSLPAGVHFDMKCFLFGDPLAVQEPDLIMIAVIAPLVLLTVWVLFHPLKLLCFDPVLARTMGINTTLLHYLLMILLSATIVAALRSVGVIMGVAMLVTPAAVGYQLTNRLSTMLVISGLTGAGSALLGLIAAFMFDWPPGPGMVLVATTIFLVAMALAPERGLIVVALRRRRSRDHILQEDVLKTLACQEEHPADPARELSASLPQVPARRLQRAVASLQRAGLLTADMQRTALTDAGRRRALELVRAHRLWETYLAGEDIADPYLHNAAEQLEHAHAVAEELARSLANPKLNPHGEPIPERQVEQEPGRL